MTPPSTRRYEVALLGHGIGPSLTPALHEREAAAHGLDYRYHVVDLIGVADADLGVELDRLEARGFVAVNVTHPFKQAMLGHVDDRSDAVEQIGAANLVLLPDGRRIAHNTDCSGFRAGLETFVGDRPRGTVIQVGAGGAGLATASSLASMGFERIIVHDVRPGVADQLAHRFAEASAGRVEASHQPLAELLSQVQGVVHVTPVGMKEHPGVAFDPALLPTDAWVAEVVYRPLVTELVRRSRELGLAVLDGGAMAVGQAVDSLRLITGLEPDRDRMAHHFHTLIDAAERVASGSPETHLE